MSLLCIQEARKTYISSSGFPVQALRGLSFSMKEGEFVTIVGHNGSGKSTLLRAIMGVAGSHLDSGSISLEALDITRQPQHRRVPAIAMLDQNPGLNLAPQLTVEENLALVGGFRRANPLRPAITKQDRLHFGQILSIFPQLDLMHRLKTPVNELSGGQLQALALLRETQARNPKLLLLDEPTASLDVSVENLLWSYLKDLVSRQKLAILMTTHNYGRIQGFGQRLIVMSGGNISSEVGPSETRSLTESGFRFLIENNLTKIDSSVQSTSSVSSFGSE